MRGGRERGREWQRSDKQKRERVPLIETRLALLLFSFVKTGRGNSFVGTYRDSADFTDSTDRSVSWALALVS